VFLQSKELYPEDNCTIHKCILIIPVPAAGSTYCVSAKGSSYDSLIVGAPSTESCIHVPLKPTMNTQYIIILCGVILSLGVMLAVCCGCKKLRKKNVKLPKSLVSVIRSLNADNILESKSEAKYLSVISFMPGQSALPVNDGVTLLEPKEATVSPENSSEGASSVPPQEPQAKAEEVSAQESTGVVSSDDEQNCKVKESYFVSDSSQMDTCSNSSEASDIEVQQTVIPSSCLKFSGYDKPHVPLDMLIDVGEEQPVIAYRPTD
ncbi:INGR1 protein, partial [Chordeiles acutipennis]|nr:INGR1 protein [Chordeiles acutipennis]